MCPTDDTEWHEEVRSFLRTYGYAKIEWDGFEATAYRPGSDEPFGRFEYRPATPTRMAFDDVEVLLMKRAPDGFRLEVTPAPSPSGAGPA